MKLSLKAIEICKMKFGKGEFYGFEQMDKSVLDHISEEEAKVIFDELMQNEILDLSEGEIHISALGQHLFYMMTDPEQYLILNNEVSKTKIRLYIRNTYYLCVTEDKEELYVFELLPFLDNVVGALISGIHCTGEQIQNKNTDKENDLWITGKAWNREKELLTDIAIKGIYANAKIRYQMIEKSEDNQQECESESSELINRLTRWIFNNISELYKSEAD